MYLVIILALAGHPKEELHVTFPDEASCEAAVKDGVLPVMSNGRRYHAPGLRVTAYCAPCLQ
jgi:hypothetical protein